MGHALCKADVNHVKGQPNLSDWSCSRAWIRNQRERQRAGLFSNFHQLQSFLISNCSNVYDCDSFISRSRGLNDDLGSCYRSITP